MTKLQSYDFFKTVLHSPKHIVAPMVDQSELAWRILSRRYGAQLTYTPMFNAKLFSTNDKYKKDNFVTNKSDRPLIVQFCANDPEILLNAAKLVQDDCDAVDINLGCPQHIAKRGHYGSFLMDEWELIGSMVKILHDNLNVPVTCKIRIFEDVEMSISYAKMLVESGCQMLVVHGRKREQKGHLTGLADWEQIKRIKESVSVPVIANGNILYKEDIDACIKYTGVDGVMTAEANLYNPALFTDTYPTLWDISNEYLTICKDIPNSANTSQIRSHLFKMLKPCLSIHTDIRSELVTIQTLEGFNDLVNRLKQRMEHELVNDTFDSKNMVKDSKGFYDIPHWRVQPYFRPPLVPNKRKLEQMELNQCIDNEP